jgi:transcriptional regulator NrdR family protein
MVKVQKRDMSWEEFVKSKVERGAKLAGATSEEAVRVADEVSKNVAKKAKVSAEELSQMVVDSLEKVDKTAAKEFKRFRAKKLESKTKT